MAKKKTPISTRPTSLLGTKEFQNITAGGIALLVAVLMFLSTRESTIVGQILSRAGLFLFGSEYRYIFSPIVAILGLMIIIRRASWSIYRFF